MIANPSVVISSVADNAGNSWYHPAGGGNQPTAQCAASDSVAGSVDCAFVLSASAGVTTVTFTFSGTSGGASVTIYEVPYTNGPLGFELPYALDRTTAAATVLAPTLNLRGTNDFIVLGINASQSVSTIGGGYLFRGNSAYLANSTNGTAPAWTLGAAGVAAVSAIAFGESCDAVPGLSNSMARIHQGTYRRMCPACQRSSHGFALIDGEDTNGSLRFRRCAGTVL